MTPLVLVHGFMGGSDQWHLQAALESSRPVIKVDLPGFGRNSQMPPIDSIEGFASWVLQTLTDQGCDRFDLMGHSMGGMIVQDLVRLAPERIGKLILYGTGPVGNLPGRFESIESSMSRAKTDGPRATARRISATWFRNGEASNEYPGCAAIAERSTLPAILAGLEAMKNWSGVPNLKHIKSPTLILWGDCDRTYPWSQTQQLWQAISGSNLAVLPACAHAVHLEQADVFNSIVDGYLQV